MLHCDSEQRTEERNRGAAEDSPADVGDSNKPSLTVKGLPAWNCCLYGSTDSKDGGTHSLPALGTEDVYVLRMPLYGH